MFASLSVYNLLLMFLLILYTQQKLNLAFILFLLLCFTTGLIAEVIGVSTGYLFGNYHYGDTLGFKVRDVPLIIGINWFIVVYCCGITMHTFLNKLSQNAEELQPRPALKAASVILDGALLAVLFDWLIEPVAVKLGYWTWVGEIPWLNYWCWFMISALLLIIFYKAGFPKHNKFAIHLLLIQAMFFLLLRTLL